MTFLPRAAVLLVLAAYALPLAVPVPLMEDDEGLHAAIALEMVERGDWTVPRLLGEPFLDKPVLYFWMQAASLSAFGASEFAVRLPGTLMALAGIAATGWLARVLWGGAVGYWAALCYATMVLPYAVSLVPLHDLVMVPLVAVALGAFWRAHRATTGMQVAVWTLVAGLTLGLSILGKGLTGVGLIGVGMATWMIWTRTWSVRLVGVAAAALVVGAVLAWPWYSAMEQASPGYLRYFLLERHVGGVVGSTQRHAGRPVWYYVPVIVAGTWPWVFAAVRRPFRQADVAEKLVLAWLLADFLLLTLAGSKLATYLLPAFPAVALLAGRAIASGAVDAPSPIPSWALRLTVVLPLAGIGVLSALDGLLPNWGGVVGVLLPVVLLGWVMRGGTRGGADGAHAALMVTAAALVGVALSILPLVAYGLTARQLSDEMNRQGVMPRTLLIVDEGIGSFLFYLRPALRQGLTPDRVQRISRFSLGDPRDPAGVLVAVASDRIRGVQELYDLPAEARVVPSPPIPGMVPPGSFHLLPFGEVRPRVP